MGQPHNIVRHPDMPPEAFEDLWTTIKAGMPWAGAVKNRRKNGDFYWVRASATPIWENGQIAGYMSIRTKLPAEQRAEAEHVYGLIRAKKAQKYTVTAGLIRRRSLADSMLRRFKMTVGRKIYALIGLSFIGVVGIALLDFARTGVGPRSAEADRTAASDRTGARHRQGRTCGGADERRRGRRRAEAGAGAGRGAAIRQQRLFLGQRHAAAHGDASDEAGDERHRYLDLQGSERKGPCSSTWSTS